MTSVPPSPTSTPPLTLNRRFDSLWLAGFAIGVVTALSLVLTLPSYGFAIDEATYVWVGREVRTWFAELPARGLADSLSADCIARRWHFLEPPGDRHADQHSNFNLPVGQYVLVAGWLIFGRFTDELTADRMGSVVLFSFCVAAVFIVMAQDRGWRAGWMCALFLLFSPRAFGHAHLAATETPLSAFWTLTLLALARTQTTNSWRQSALVAILAGTTAAVKLTGWFLAIPILLWLLIARPPGWRRTLLFCATLGVATVIILTPNLWHRPIGGLIDYVRAAAENPWKIATIYGGNVYPGRLPLASTWMLLYMTTPTFIFIFGMLGLLRSLVDRVHLLFSLSMGTLIIARMAGWMPEHDGDRQFLPVFYFLAIAAGLVVDNLAPAIASCFRWGGPKTKTIGSWVFVIFLIEPAFDAWTYRDHALSYYSRIPINGLFGANAHGEEVSYWFESATDDVWRNWLADLPPNSRIFLRPDHPGLEFLIERGLWRADLKSVGPNEADFWLLSARKAAYAIPVGDGRLLMTDLWEAQQHAPAWKGREIRFQGVRLLVLIAAPKRLLR